MSDELVQRLRKRQEFEFIDGYKRIEWEDEDALEAADRIDALTAKVKLMDDLDVINGEKIEALEAKLAKAVELGDKMAKSIEGNYYTPGLVGEWRATLAEIEGEKP
jgi:hypothetical protein